MKNMEYLTKNIHINWANPILGLMTAHYWFTGALTSNWWWALIIPMVLAGNYNKSK